MKYTRETLEKAVYYLLPTFKVAKEKGISFVMPNLIKEVAWDYFVSNGGDGRDFKKQMAYYIVRDAAVDLEKKGQFNFGDLEDHDLDWKRFHGIR